MQRQSYRRLRSFFLPLLLLVIAPSFSFGQNFANKIPELEVFGGYSYLRFDGQPAGFSGTSDLDGAIVAITAPHLYQALGLRIDASENFGSQVKIYNYLIGPQLSYQRGRLGIFGDVTFGKAGNQSVDSRSA